MEEHRRLYLSNAMAQRYESDISLPRATRNIVRVHSFHGANIIRWISAAMFPVVTVLGSIYHDIIVAARKRNNKPSNGVWNCGHSGRDWMQLQTRQFYQPVSSHAHQRLPPFDSVTYCDGRQRRMTHSRLVFPNPNTFSLDAIAI